MSSRRKNEHLKLALKQKKDHNDSFPFVVSYNGLPDKSIHDINLETKIFNQTFSYPFYINAMTGGTKKAYKFNKKLAIIANKYNLAIVTGSMSIALKDESSIASFKVIREYNKNGFIIANLSANATVDECKKAIALIDANALSIHINLLQELIMEEGDRDFSSWSKNIKNIVDNIDVPVIVKEVGFGMNEKTIKRLVDLGVKYIDISGKGGTNFAKIENKRGKNRYSYLENIGYTTYESLLYSQKHQNDVTIFASGGIKNALDIYQALSLGAKAVGMANFFLKLTKLNEKKAFKKIDELILDLKKIKLFAE